MKISREKAETVANKLLAKRKEKLSKKRAELVAWCETRREESIPKEVMDAYKLHPSYIREESTIYVSGEGIDYKMRWQSSGSYMPSNGNAIPLNSKDAAFYVKKWNEIEDESKKIKRAEKTLTESILSFGTYAKLKASFPEAYELLPEQNTINTSLMVKVDDLRKLFKE